MFNVASSTEIAIAFDIQITVQCLYYHLAKLWIAAKKINGDARLSLFPQLL